MNIKMHRCLSCRREAVKKLLDFGPQPISSRFLGEKWKGKEYLHPMILGQCHGCGLLQMISPVPAAELRPLYDWISYAEPEEHLDKLAERIAALPGISKDSEICGLSYKDSSTINRLRGMGFKSSWLLGAGDLGISGGNFGVETVQEAFPKKAAEIAKIHGRQDVIILRHIVEHTHDTASFVEALRMLLNEKGYIVVEAPDCSNSVKRLDYTMMWEEHTMYFTPLTFGRFFRDNGFVIDYFEAYPYPLENSLIGIGSLGAASSDGSIGSDMAEAGHFAKNFAITKKKVRGMVSSKIKNGSIALFGAGHFACVFINFFGLGEFIDCVIDDNPKKVGRLMPGSHIPIRSSSVLFDGGIRLCLLSLNPGKEEAVVQKNSKFAENGGTFLSIFPGGSHSMFLSR